MNQTVTYFGIRHHGPGCAHSLRVALDALKPDCVVIEGPAGAQALLSFLTDEQMCPPVALLSYSVDDPSLSFFHPFAEFSPEWQAMSWAQQAQVPVQFMDLPSEINLALQKIAREKRLAALAAITQQAGDEAQEQNQDSSEEEGESKPQPPEHEPNEITLDDVECEDAQDQESDDETIQAEMISSDPLDWLARAAGFPDGESWWNYMVEERGDGADLFDSIRLAMTELRNNPPQGLPKRREEDEQREAMREAQMRLTIKAAQKEGFKRIAVVCGAWHVPGLEESHTVAADKALLKDAPKLKAQLTWVPWTYEHLSMQSGYAAGIASPGWYDYLWKSWQASHQYGGYRSVGWFVRIAQLLRERDLDCSSAHLIEASRLADTLSAMRARPAPGLRELNEAALSVICNGDDAPMRLIERELMIGRALGSVPLGVPTVPLQRDVQALQKSLRLKPEALEKTLDLDLRKETDLARSQLLHRFNLLGINWGEVSRFGQKGKGTFHEVWRLAWQPGFEVDIIVASRYGYTVETAAQAKAIESAQDAEQLQTLTALIDKVLLANLPQAVQTVAQILEERSVSSADPLELLAALPALANVYRYGNVRQTQTVQVAALFDSMLLRGAIALPLALSNINEEAAEQARDTVLAAGRAVSLRDGEQQTQQWAQALKQTAQSESCAALLRGLCTRLLLDDKVYSLTQASQALSLNLSSGADASKAAQWLDGFLNRNAAVLLHNDEIWSLIDVWLSGLSDGHFVQVLPLVRRTFSGFEQADRRDLGERVKHSDGAASASTATRSTAADESSVWNEARAAQALPMLSELLGVDLDVADDKGAAV